MSINTMGLKMAKRQIIIEIEDLDVSQITDNKGYAMRLSIQINKNGKILAQDSIACFASILLRRIIEFLEHHRKHLETN